jgi:polyhydroxybutyrate depolymerase
MPAVGETCSFGRCFDEFGASAGVFGGIFTTMPSLRTALVSIALLAVVPATPALTPSCGCGEAPPVGPGSSTTLAMGPAEDPGIRDGSFILHVPVGYETSTALPLVIGLHGWTGSGSGLMGGSKLDVSADAMGFVVAFPDGVNYPQAGRGWAFPGCNASPPVGEVDACGRRAVCTDGDRYDCDATTCPSTTCSESSCTTTECACTMGQNSNCNWCGCVDDEAFIRALVNDIASRMCIDLDRVYLTGMSQGGMMTSWLSGRMDDVFAAFAPVSGTDPRDFRELPPASADVGVMWIHGTNDNTVPHDGTPASDTFMYEAAWDEADHFAQALGCDVSTSNWPIPPSVGAPANANLECLQHASCPEATAGSGNREVGYCLWQGGHTWPKRSGVQESTLWGNRLMVEFFLRHAISAATPNCDCSPPAQPLVLSAVAVDGSGFPVLTFQDANPPGSTTGINVYLSPDPFVAPELWDEVGSDLPDQDPVEPGHQWVDTSGEIPLPGEVFYYDGAAYDSVCSAEGPR